MKSFDKIEKNFKKVELMFKIFLIFAVSFFFAYMPSNGINNDNKATNIADNKLKFDVVDQMALTYIQSRYSDIKYVDEEEKYYFIYFKVDVENITDEIISFGAQQSDYYIKMKMGKLAPQAVYFRENIHLHDRIPYWVPLNDKESWKKIVFFYADETITRISPNEKRSCYFAFQTLRENKNLNIELIVYKSKGFKSEEILSINIGIIPIKE